MRYFISLFVFVASSTIAFSQQIQIKDSKVEMPVAQPLYVIDGKVFSSINIEKDSTEAIVSLQSIKPSEIQSIEIVKDLVAIEKYGQAGKNGVVIITTFGSANKKD